MKTALAFHELTVWQRSIELSVQIYGFTRAFPKDEIFGLTNQLRRASVSISSNIAEGQSRLTRGEFINFLSIARGSNAEVRSQLALARRLNFGDEAQNARCQSLATEISKMLNALIITLKSKSPQPPKPSPNR